jgi:hypothetical protein
VRLASGKPLADDDTVTVAASDFLALGGDDLASLAPGTKSEPKIDEDGPTLRDVVAAGLKRRGSVRADDPSLFDPAHPRLAFPSARPVKCSAAN